MKKVRWYVVAAVVALVVAGGAYAAWRLTKSTEVQGMVLGTFSFTVGACTDCMEGDTDPGHCAVEVRNDTDAGMLVEGPTLTVVPDNPLVSVSNLMPTSNVNMPPGETSQITWDYTPEPGCEPGEVVFTIELTCSG